MAPTANVCEGHQEKIKTGEWVMVSWEGKEVWGKILKLHGKWWSVDSSKFSYGHFLCKESNLGDTAFQCVIPYSLFMLEVGLVLSDSTDVTLLS